MHRDLAFLESCKIFTKSFKILDNKLLPLILESQQRSHTLWDVYKIVNDPMGLSEELNFSEVVPQIITS